MEKISLPNQFILHPEFKKKVLAIQRDVNLPLIPSPTNITKDDYFPHNSKVTLEEEFGKKDLDALNGKNLLNNYTILSYDESIDKFQALEGSGYLTCHSLIMIDDDDYIPSTCLSFNFYTRSKLLLEKNNSMRDVRKVENEKSEIMDMNDKIEAAFKADYVKDRNKFILENTPDNSILFIDGPLIGKQMSGSTVKLNMQLLEKSIIPIFITKNSSSNLVTDNIQNLYGKFNSDLHWAHQFLKPSQRTSFFRYTDQTNSNFSKIFCYLKPFQVSPQRIEFHPSTYIGRKDFISQLMNIIQYLFLIQGDSKNSQIRPIAIAEKFARENKKIVNINKIFAESEIQPTMNQARGFV